MSMRNVKTVFFLKTPLLGLFSFCLSMSLQVLAKTSNRPVVTVEEAFEMVRSGSQLEPEIKVRVFPHDNDYAPHGIDLDRTQVELQSPEGVCRVYSITEVNGETKLKLLLQTQSARFDAAKIKNPLFVKCSHPTLIKRNSIADAKNFIYIGTFTVLPVDVIAASNSGKSQSRRSKELMVINHVSLSDYLRGVVPSEISPSWPMESLKTQAVAARTYALFQIAYAKKYQQSMEYDVDDTITYQVYTGITHHHSRTDIAIQETKGEVLTYNDEIVQAFFHADSGGETENSEDVFVVPLPYISKVREQKTYSKAYSSTWEKSISISDLKKTIGADRLGGAFGLIENVIVEKEGRLKSGRVKELKLVFTSGQTVEISGPIFKKRFGLPSLMFSIERRGPHFIIKGKGSGHGVGLNQTGALQLAKDHEWSYQKILGFYYPATKICQRKYADEDVVFSCAM